MDKNELIKCYFWWKKNCVLSAMFLLVFVEFSFISCNMLEKQDFEELSFCCWNVQTFFDGNNDGCEYSEFRKNQAWNNDAYLVRLKRLAEVIQTLDCDVFVLEEIENEGVVVDITNQLAGNDWRKSKCWNYTCFAKEDGSAIGCAVFSRFLLSDMKTHTIDVRTEDDKQPSSRPMIQVTVNAGEKQMVLFVNHWKSKSNGFEESEVWRNWQESLLTDRICAVQKEFGENVPIIACGDFNRDIGEFAKVIDSTDFLDVSRVFGNLEFDSEKESNFGFKNTGNIVLRNFYEDVLENDGFTIVYSPWIKSDGSYVCESGSYFYKNSWERIDQIFSCGNSFISEFESESRGKWATDEGIPIPYKIYTGQGYSDHLPLRCKIRLN